MVVALCEQAINTVTMKTCSHVPLKSPFLSAAPLIFLTYSNVMCEQHHRISFYPILNGKKNGIFNGACESSATQWVDDPMYFSFAFSHNSL